VVAAPRRLAANAPRLCQALLVIGGGQLEWSSSTGANNPELPRRSPAVTQGSLLQLMKTSVSFMQATPNRGRGGELRNWRTQSLSAALDKRLRIKFMVQFKSNGKCKQGAAFCFHLRSGRNKNNAVLCPCTLACVWVKDCHESAKDTLPSSIFPRSSDALNTVNLDGHIAETKAIEAHNIPVIVVLLHDQCSAMQTNQDVKPTRPILPIPFSPIILMHS
jgi:hypothetical protein